jgi:hypothetical protein
VSEPIDIGRQRFLDFVAVRIQAITGRSTPVAAPDMAASRVIASHPLLVGDAPWARSNSPATPAVSN